MMKKFLLIVAVAVVLASTFLLMSPAGPADAATSNPSPGSSGYQLVCFGPYSTLTASTTNIARFIAPWPARLIEFSASSRLVSGTSPSMMLQIRTGATTTLVSSMTLTTNTAPVEATLNTNPNITDESAVSVDAIVSGTTPSFVDTTFCMGIKRL